jgi:quinol monooxygenase YgiN
VGSVGNSKRSIRDVHLLQIEHPVSDFDTWKGAFDSFADFRQQSGVRRYRVLQPTDDPNYVIIELEFDSSSEAEAFLAALRRNVWSSREAAPALRGEPQTRIVEAVEVKEY